MNLADEITRSVSSADYPALVKLLPYAQWLGIQIELKQELLYIMPFAEKLLNNKQRMTLHGGSIAGFMENAALFETLIQQRQRRIPKPIDFSIDYLRRGQAENTYASVEIVREGRRVALARVNCWQTKAESPIAQARVHLLLE